MYAHSQAVVASRMREEDRRHAADRRAVLDARAVPGAGRRPASAVHVTASVAVFRLRMRLGRL